MLDVKRKSEKKSEKPNCTPSVVADAFDSCVLSSSLSSLSPSSSLQPLMLPLSKVRRLIFRRYMGLRWHFNRISIIGIIHTFVAVCAVRVRVWVCAVAVCVKEMDGIVRKGIFGGAQKRATEEMRYCGAVLCCAGWLVLYTNMCVYMRFVLLHFRPFCAPMLIEMYSNLFTKICCAALFFGVTMPLDHFVPIHTHEFIPHSANSNAQRQSEWVVLRCAIPHANLLEFCIHMLDSDWYYCCCCCRSRRGVCECACVYNSVPYSYGPNTVCIIQFSPNSCVITTHILRIDDDNSTKISVATLKFHYSLQWNWHLSPQSFHFVWIHKTKERHSVEELTVCFVVDIVFVFVLFKKIGLPVMHAYLLGCGLPRGICETATKQNCKL